MVAVTSVAASPDARTVSIPSGAQSTHTTVTPVAPRSASVSSVVTSDPPVASIGSNTTTCRPDRSAGSEQR